MVEGEEEAESEEEEVVVVGEALAQREGRRRLAGRLGLKKFFRTEEASSSGCEETDELTLRVITLFSWQTITRSYTLHGVTCPIGSLLGPGGNNRHISNRNTILVGSRGKRNISAFMVGSDASGLTTLEVPLVPLSVWAVRLNFCGISILQSFTNFKEDWLDNGCLHCLHICMTLKPGNHGSVDLWPPRRYLSNYSVRAGKRCGSLWRN